MTIDVTIGKLIFLTFEEVCQNKLQEEYCITYEDTVRLTDSIDVEECPSMDDGSDPKQTIYPNHSYRSGATTAWSDFFDKIMPELDDKIRPIKSNDPQVSLLKPYIDEINKLTCDIEDHKHRFKWFIFWCNKAVELYGWNAAIKFT